MLVLKMDTNSIPNSPNTAKLIAAIAKFLLCLSPSFSNHLSYLSLKYIIKASVIRKTATLTATPTMNKGCKEVAPTSLIYTGYWYESINQYKGCPWIAQADIIPISIPPQGIIPNIGRNIIHLEVRILEIFIVL
ncbi:hypothetical protein WICPIJ_009782 [Wickerhamomyces pijperi]|uniref:Uncharacterized protein n=1 Tax=Wickerhamomyces pijperi TaxID=599730 RepID=A0A9P8PLE5_WICPI|nr:hypothetical protein WICPIJ_009782 [Wickerhamomyces pijperi]